MKIALLNLPLDNNYGGNLQRYALIKTLERMGHEVTYLLCKSNFDDISLSHAIARSCKRAIKKYILNYEVGIISEMKRRNIKLANDKKTLSFVCDNINVSTPIHNKKELIEFSKNNTFDAYIVGSDQVWRKKITQEYGLHTYFLDFLYDIQSLKIAFAASLGTDENELSEDEIKGLRHYYCKFNFTSVREISGADLLHQYKCDIPVPTVLLDPAFLLSKDDYKQLINKGCTKQSRGNMFCYILDSNKYKRKIINDESKYRNLKPFYASLNDECSFSIYQWLRSFEDSEFIVTDSFHGVVFALIFNKPFKYIRNTFRGNARFDSLFQMLGIDNVENVNWEIINRNINEQKCRQLSFLESSLEQKI